MCLTSETIRSIKATSDIVCYKVLLKKRNSLVSPFYQNFKWKFREIVEPRDKAGYRFISNHIQDGYLHTFSSIYGAEDMVKDSSMRDHLRIYKCIIPKGAYYYKGIQSGGCYGYASKKVKLVELVKKEQKNESSL